MYEVVYAAGEWCESRSEADRARAGDAFATWKNWVERAIPMGAWVVAEPEQAPGQWPAAREEGSWASDDSEVSL